MIIIAGAVVARADGIDELRGLSLGTWHVA